MHIERLQNFGLSDKFPKRSSGKSLLFFKIFKTVKDSSISLGFFTDLDLERQCDFRQPGMIVGKIQLEL